MHIIFGDAINEVAENFTVLELDTFRWPQHNRTETAYCVVEKVALTEFATFDAVKKIHSDLIAYYKKREWNYCEKAIEGLIGKWNGDLDTFYTDLLARVLSFKETPPPEDWDGTIDRFN